MSVRMSNSRSHRRSERMSVRAVRSAMRNSCRLFLRRRAAPPPMTVQPPTNSVTQSHKFAYECATASRIVSPRPGSTAVRIPVADRCAGKRSALALPRAATATRASCAILRMAYASAFARKIRIAQISSRRALAIRGVAGVWPSPKPARSAPTALRHNRAATARVWCVADAFLPLIALAVPMVSCNAVRTAAA